LGIVFLRCKKCNGECEFDDSKQFGFCKHCGTKLVIKDDIVNNTFNTTQNIKAKNVTIINAPQASGAAVLKTLEQQMGIMNKSIAAYNKSKSIENEIGEEAPTAPSGVGSIIAGTLIAAVVVPIVLVVATVIVWAVVYSIINWESYGWRDDVPWEQIGPVIFWIATISAGTILALGSFGAIFNIANRKNEDREYKTKLSEYEKKNAKALTRLKTAEAEYKQHYRNAIAITTGVHEHYIQYLPELVEYFKRGRADSIKEAINLYERNRGEERCKQELIDKIYEIKKAI